MLTDTNGSRGEEYSSSVEDFQDAQAMLEDGRTRIPDLSNDRMMWVHPDWFPDEEDRQYFLLVCRVRGFVPQDGYYPFPSLALPLRLTPAGARQYVEDLGLDFIETKRGCSFLRWLGPLPDYYPRDLRALSSSMPYGDRDIPEGAPLVKQGPLHALGRGTPTVNSVGADFVCTITKAIINAHTLHLASLKSSKVAPKKAKALEVTFDDPLEPSKWDIEPKAGRKPKNPSSLNAIAAFRSSSRDDEDEDDLTSPHPDVQYGVEDIPGGHAFSICWSQLNLADTLWLSRGDEALEFQDKELTLSSMWPFVGVLLDKASDDDDKLALVYPAFAFTNKARTTGAISTLFTDFPVVDIHVDKDGKWKTREEQDKLIHSLMIQSTLEGDFGNRVLRYLEPSRQATALKNRLFLLAVAEDEDSPRSKNFCCTHLRVFPDSVLQLSSVADFLETMAGEFQSRRQDLALEIRDLRRKLQSLLISYGWANTASESLKSSFLRTLTQQLGVLKRHALVKSIAVFRTSVVLRTHEVYASVSYSPDLTEVESETRYLGEFEFRLEINGFLKYRNLAVVPDGPYHPHDEDGDYPCLGSYDRALQSALSNFRLDQVFLTLLDWCATTSHTDTSAVRRFRKLPRERPAKTTVGTWSTLIESSDLFSPAEKLGDPIDDEM